MIVRVEINGFLFTMVFRVWGSVPGLNTNQGMWKSCQWLGGRLGFTGCSCFLQHLQRHDLAAMWQNSDDKTRFLVRGSGAEIVFILKPTSLYQVVGMVGLRSVCDWQGWLWGLFLPLEGRASSPISCVVIDSYMYQYHWLARLHLVPITYIPETTASNAYTTDHTSHRSEVQNDNHSTYGTSCERVAINLDYD